MRTEQLSNKDQQRVSDALAKCAAETKSIDDSNQLAEAAYGIFKESLGDNPRLFKVACRVYNSCKSIHKLSSADDATRGDTFAILDANALADRLSQESAISMRKAASAPAIFSVAAKPATSCNMRKAASSESSKPQGVVAVSLSGAEKRAALIDVIDGWEDLVKEASSDVRAAEREYASALDLFIASLSSVPSNLRKSAAAKVYANYGKLADNAIKEFNVARPMYKVASADYVDKYKGTPVIDDIYLASAMEKLATADLKRSVKKHFLAKVATECTQAVRDLVTGIRKSASIADTAIRTAIAGDLMSGVPGILGYDYTEEWAKKRLNNSELENAILSAGSRRAFIKALHNDTIASYPLPDIVDAFNKSYASLPPSARRMPATRNQALINAEMIATLAEGNTPSKADREHLLSIMKQYDAKNPVGVVEGLVVG